MKRFIDVFVSVLGLVLICPWLTLIACCIRLTMGRPVFFRQTRVGLAEQAFTLYKFRTMTDRRDASGKLLPDADRLTRVGAFLRRSSLDEIPQLWNVLKGDMSLVGPRPLLRRYLPYYTTRERIRHMARPGITGLAQVSGRNLLGWDERLELDVQYVENYSLLLDFRILARTLLQTLRRAGVEVIPGAKGMPLDVARRNICQNENSNAPTLTPRI